MLRIFQPAIVLTTQNCRTGRPVRVGSGTGPGFDQPVAEWIRKIKIAEFEKPNRVSTPASGQAPPPSGILWIPSGSTVKPKGVMSEPSQPGLAPVALGPARVYSREELRAWFALPTIFLTLSGVRNLRDSGQLGGQNDSWLSTAFRPGPISRERKKSESPLINNCACRRA